MVFCRWLRGAWGINEKNDPHYADRSHRGVCRRAAWLVVNPPRKKGRHLAAFFNAFKP